MYFQFTSLSTVGLGDFHPESSLERLLCSFILFTGALLFSFIMGFFIKIVVKLREINDDTIHDHELGKFFNVLKQFNYQKEINQKF